MAAVPVKIHVAGGGGDTIHVGAETVRDAVGIQLAEIVIEGTIFLDHDAMWLTEVFTSPVAAVTV